MEKNNIFKNAYFGKAYKTRDGRKAILISYNQRKPMEPYVCAVACYLDDSIKSNCYNFNEFGRRRTDLMSDSDIVSEWQEVNEDELCETALNFVVDFLNKNEICLVPYKHYNEIGDGIWNNNHFDCNDLTEAFEAGYRKSRENRK